MPLGRQLGARRRGWASERWRPPGDVLRRMIRRSAATAAAACTSSSGFVRTLARGRGRGPRGAPGRRREPRHELPQPQQPPQRPAATTTAEASPAADTTSATPINASDKRLAWASLVFGSLAICSLTLNKWEVEKRWEATWEKPPKRIRPICSLASDLAQGGTQPRPASVYWQMFWRAGLQRPIFFFYFPHTLLQAQGAAARGGGAVEVRRVRGDR